MRVLRDIYRRMSDPTIPMSVAMSWWLIIIILVILVAAAWVVAAHVFG
jgi:hypothetical protein